MNVNVVINLKIFTVISVSLVLLIKLAYRCHAFTISIIYIIFVIPDWVLCRLLVQLSTL